MVIWQGDFYVEIAATNGVIGYRYDLFCCMQNRGVRFYRSPVFGSDVEVVAAALQHLFKVDSAPARQL